MRRLLLAASVAFLPAIAHAAAPAAPAWSFASPLGGFDLGAAQRGFTVYEERCASCHGMAALAPADLLRLGLPAERVRAELHRLGHPPFTAGASGPDLSRTERVTGPDALWTLLLAPDTSAAYNALPPGHPVLTSRAEASDLVTFLAWAAHPNQTLRRQVGVAGLLFGLLGIGLAVAATRRNRHG